MEPWLFRSSRTRAATASFASPVIFPDVKLKQSRSGDSSRFSKALLGVSPNVVGREAVVERGKSAREGQLRVLGGTLVAT